MPPKYTRDEKAKAAAALLGYGTSTAASEVTGYPASTIRHWANNDEEFQEIYLDFQIEYGEDLKRKYALLATKAADEALDRVTHGDHVLNTKTGEMTRVPIKGRDLAVVSGVALDKLRLLENQPTQIVRQEDTQEQLKRLADKFKEIANEHMRKIDTDD